MEERHRRAVGEDIIERLSHIEWALHRIEQKLGLINMKENWIIMDLSALQTAVEADTSATSSAITLLTTLAEELRAAAGDPAAVQAIADQITANATQLSDAVVANTPAAP